MNEKTTVYLSDSLVKRKPIFQSGCPIIASVVARTVQLLRHDECSVDFHAQVRASNSQSNLRILL